MKLSVNLVCMGLARTWRDMAAVVCTNLGSAIDGVMIEWCTGEYEEKRQRHEKEGRRGEWWWSHTSKVQVEGGGREEEEE